MHKTLRIGGMTCINCQNRIEQKLRNTAGVREVTVSYTTGEAHITYDTDILSLGDITGVVEGLDYEVLPEEEGQKPDVSRVICILVIIVSLYLLLQRFGILNLLVPSRLADTTMGYGMLFVVGLLTSVHCIAMCGGINLSQCIPRQKGDCVGTGAARPLLPSVLYHLGRVVSYTVIGFLLGLVGFLLGGGSEVGLSALAQGILKLIAGGFMVIMGVNMLGLFPPLRRLTIRPPAFLTARLGVQAAKSGQPLAVGLLNGLMPCGPLQSMQIVALACANPFVGALSMFLFSLGTVPLMLGLSSIVSVLGKRFARTVTNVGAVLVVVLGLAMLSQGGSLSGLLQPDYLFFLIVIFCVLGVVASIPFPRQSYRLAGLAVTVCVAAFALSTWGKWSAAAQGSADGSAGASQAEMVDGVQVVSSTLSSGRYPNITVQASTPVKWIIDAPAGSINGCNYKMMIQDYGIEYAFQEGENIIEFTPTQTGTVSYSCWMGMIRGNIFVTDGDGVEAAAAMQAEVDGFETIIYPAEVFSAGGTTGSCCG